MDTAKLKKHFALLLISSLAFVQTAKAATVTLAPAPLANITTSVVYPNIMFVLDNSLSMGWDYLPDYVSSGAFSTGSQICWSGTHDADTLTTCNGVGSTGSDVAVPYTTSDVNYIYYNPTIRYSPPIKADKTSYPNSTVTAAYTNGFAATGSMNFKNATTVVTLTGATTNGSTSVTGLASSEGLVGTFVTGTGMPADVYVTAAPTAASITLSAAATSTGSPSLTFKSGGYTHQVYCNIGGPTEQNKRGNGAVCRETSDSTGGNLYPLATTGFTTVKSYNGPAYYYTMSPKEYCTDSFFTDCQAAADGTHTVPALYRWCSSYTPATIGVAGTFNSCQDIRDQSHIIPDYLGSVIPGAAGVKAYADLIVTASPTPGLSITQLNVGGTNIIASTISVASGDSATVVAQRICTAISVNSGFSGYDCPTTPVSGTLRIVANTVGVNTLAVAVVGPAGVAGTQASGSITVNSTAAATIIQDITVNGTSLLASGDKPMSFADGTQTNTIATFICAKIESHKATSGYGCPSTAGAQVNIQATTVGTAQNGAIVVTANAIAASRPTAAVNFSSVTSNGPHAITIKAGSNNTCAAGTVTLFNGNLTTNSTTCGGSSNNQKRARHLGDVLYSNAAGTATAAVGWADSSAACSGTVTYSAPAGTANNNWYLCNTLPGGGVVTSSVASPSATRFLGGIDAVTGQSTSTVAMGSIVIGTDAAGPIATNAPTAMANGVDTIAGGRANVGIFKRVDIVPSVDSYAKASGRTDCAGATCTYDEELQNFANWYSYYRTRLLMMKSASTTAFDNLDNKFRVGFDLLSHNNSGAVDLEVAQFDNSSETVDQRTNWWNNLTNATTSGSTPLRTETNKIGKYYAGKLTSAAATPAVAETPATGSIGISSANNGAIFTSIQVEGVEILGAPLTASCASTPCSSTQRKNFATTIKNTINAYVAAHPAIPQYVASCGGSSCTTTTITLTAPPVTVATDPAAPTVDGQGSYFNANAVTYTKAGSAMTVTTTPFSGGKDSKPAVPATTFEPLQYSCQQNYTLLVTDGYWNSDNHADLTLLDGSPEIANQDNVLYDVNNHPDGAVLGQYDGAQPSATCDDSTFSSCGTLADIAMYYYKNDLRDSSLNNVTNAATGTDVAANNVFVSPNDDNKKQHMVFFGMGLGAPGTLRYRTDYLTALSGDYYDIVAGTKNWPAPQANDPTTIDDLWHATVNGHGKYFSARDPVSASAGLKDALTSITARVGSAAAAATSNLKPVSGDNFAYVASYETISWVGDVQARTINLVTGGVNSGLDANNNSTCGQALVNGQGCPWSAQVLLDAKTYGTRSIYIGPSSGVSGDPLRLFDYANLSGATAASGEKAYFDPSTLSQYASAHTSYPSDVTATNLVNFLRGDRSMEANGNASQKQIWRKRDHVLGDIVSTQPAFVKKPAFSYLDAGYYNDFATIGTAASRPGMLYISSNDGMLHAFNADTGQEQWAFIPKEVLPVMKALADSNYAHRYFVDGQISVGDVNFGGGANDWHTILVAGLGGGGKEYFAIDITDPVIDPNDSTKGPQFLWEISNNTTGFANLGYTFGNPSINKLPNGEWAVFFSSGYNNADGHGYLYAVNPKTGALKTGFPMSTATASPTGDGGTPASPSNLGKMSAWVTDVRTNNTAEFFYGGDMNGNVWRFDLDTGTTGHTSTPVFKLAELKNASNQVQPITSKLELTKVGTTPVVFVATGQYLSQTDLTNTEVQSLYAIKDTLGVANLGGASQETWHPRSDTGTVNGAPNTPLFLSRTITNSTDSNGDAVRIVCDTAAINPITGACGTGVTLDYLDYGGWYTDFPDTGERNNVDMNLTLGTLTFPTNVPNSSACNSGGYSWINYVDFKTGLAIAAQNDVTGQPIMGKKVEGALTVGINVVQLPGGTLAAIVTTSDYRNVTVTPAFSSESFTGHRDFWRELQVY